MSRQKNTVFVIDPDEAVHDALRTLLSATGTNVVCYPNAESFLESIFTQDLIGGCLLAEADLPGMGSLALLRRLQARDINIPIVVLTSTSNRDIADQALKAGATEVIEKPVVGARLLERLRQYNC